MRFWRLITVDEVWTMDCCTGISLVTSCTLLFEPPRLRTPERIPGTRGVSWSSGGPNWKNICPGGEQSGEFSTRKLTEAR